LRTGGERHRAKNKHQEENAQQLLQPHLDSPHAQALRPWRVRLLTPLKD
jgi:hypothetical protein